MNLIPHANAVFMKINNENNEMKMAVKPEGRSRTCVGLVKISSDRILHTEHGHVSRYCTFIIQEALKRGFFKF